MRRFRKRRLAVCLGVVGMFLVYIVRVEILNSYDSRRQKEILSSDYAVAPVEIDFDHEKYIAAEIHHKTNNFEKHSFNHEISDKTLLDRKLPDSRNSRCANMVYSIPSSFSVSVIISFHNEARSALLRTVISILNRTPSALLKEIILVDDYSDNAKDGSELTELPKVKLIRNFKRQGLAKSRMVGVHKSTGSHVIFLDSHCEVNVDWLPPLLETVFQNPKALVSPVIDIIDADTFQYKASSGELKGGFDWALNFRWQPVSDRDENDPAKYTFFKSPVIQGGLFLVNKSWFNELGGFDKGLDVWGAENIEVSLKAWLCGGSVLTAPCSRVGHVFRSRHPYSFPPNGSLSTYLRNAKRVAEAWMDEHKYQFYHMKPQAKTHRIGSIEAILSVKRKLKCKNFQWYLDNVYPELKPLSKDALALGQLQQENLCLQNQNSTASKSAVILVDCAPSKTEQEWHFSKSGELRQGKSCLTARLNIKKPKIYLTKCTNNVKQKWSRRRRALILQNLCLENAMDAVSGHTYLTLNPCRQKAFSQNWDFSVELQAWDDR